MAPSFDSVSSLLHCGEDESVFDENDEFRDHRSRSTRSVMDRRLYDWNRSFNVGCLMHLRGEECLSLMLEKERDYMPKGDYLKRLQSGDLDLIARNEAVDWIFKVHCHFGFGPLCGHMSINYLDRFISAYELPRGKAWMMQLLAVTCLSLSAKMNEADAPLSLDLLVGESRFVFEARTIQRMELLVLSTLQWKMQTVTPLSFLDYFLSKICGCDQIALETSISTSIQLFASAMGGLELLEFKPSEIGAAVAILAAEKSLKVEDEIAMASLAQCVEKERVLECIQVMQKLWKGDSASLSAPESPVGVLDAEPCLSYRSDDTTATTVSCPCHSHASPDSKRRRLATPSEIEPLKLEFFVEGE